MIADEFLTQVRLDAAGNPERPLPEILAGAAEGWLLLTDGEGTLNPDIKKLLLQNSAVRPDVALFYGDEIADAADRNKRISGVFKSQFDLSQLLATDYIGWPLLVRADAFAAVAPSCRESSGAFSYDLLLRLASAGYGVERIAEVLSVRNGPPRRAPAVHRRAIIEHWLAENDPDCELLEGRVSETFRLSRRFENHPHVTLVVPTRQAICQLGGPGSRGRPHILNMLESLARTSWPSEQLTVLIGDDLEDASIYESRPWPFALKRILTTRAAGTSFNYAQKMNRLWREAESEHVIFMNDDLVVREPGWIEALLTFTTQEGVGGAGARLLYPDERIQHAGMAGGPMGACTHVFVGMQAQQRTYGDWADIHREWSMVTGAVFATRRSLLEQIGGFDERFSLEFNDIDMCMRMRMLGYRIVYTPHAELTHFESASRNQTRRPGSEVALFLQRWREIIADDPAYNPRLTRNSTDPASTAVAVPIWL